MIGTVGRGRLAALAAAALLATAGCDTDALLLATEQERELAWARDRWEASGVRSYAYLLDVDCDGCPAAVNRVVEVVVYDGEVWSVTDYQTGAAVDPWLFRDFATVEAQFDLIEDALYGNANSVTALYEERWGLGHPEAVEIDYDGFRNDDEVSFFALTELEILD